MRGKGPPAGSAGETSWYRILSARRAKIIAATHPLAYLHVRIRILPNGPMATLLSLLMLRVTRDKFEEEFRGELLHFRGMVVNAMGSHEGWGDGDD